MKRFRMTCTGTEPLLMHNARLSNPLDDIARMMKKVTSKRSKTDDDYEELARLEFLGGLYFDAELGPFLPGQNFERCLLDAARASRSGKKIERGVFVETNVNPISYQGPRQLDALWADQNFRHQSSVKVGTNRVTRTRPMFRNWTVYTEGVFDPSLIDFEELKETAARAGRMIGMGDWRPRYGRFVAEMDMLGNA